MKKIAIISSGESRSTERLATLFNEGNRIRVAMVATDADPEQLRERLAGCDVEVVGITPESTLDEIVAIGNRMKEEGYDLIALDGYSGLLADWLQEHAGVSLLRLTDAQQAPREVVAALEGADKAAAAASEQVPEKPKTVDEEWAETLQIDFRTPPPVPNHPAPEAPRPEMPGQPGLPKNPYYGTDTPHFGIQSGARYAMGAPKSQQEREPMPPTYLVMSVIITILCCTIPGIVAIVYSSQVSSKYYVGDLEGARRSSRNAEIWIIVSFVLGVLSSTLYLPLTFLGS